MGGGVGWGELEEGGENGRGERAEGRAPGLPGTDLLSPAGALGGVGGTNRDGLGPQSREGSGRAPGERLSPSLVPPPHPPHQPRVFPQPRGSGARGGRGGGGRVLQPKQLRSAGHCPHGARGHCSRRCGSRREGSFPRLVPPPPLSPPPRHSHTGLAGPQPPSRGKKGKKKTPTTRKKNNNNNNNKGPGRGARGPPGRLPLSWEKRGGGGRLSVPQHPVPVSLRLVSPYPRVREAAPGSSQRGRER